MRRSDLFHALQGFDTTLSLLGFSRFCLESINKITDVGDFRLLFLISRLLICQMLGTSDFKVRIITGIQFDALLFDMGDMGNHSIEKLTIMGNYQQRSRITA